MGDIDSMIEKLLEMDIVGKDGTVTFSDEAKKLIHEISDRCKRLSIHKETRDRADEYGNGLTAGEVFVDMLHKIIEAPTRIHMVLSARLLIPVVSQKLKEEREG